MDSPMKGILFVAGFIAASRLGFAAEYPAPREADGILTNFTFASGEKLPELRIHYHTVGRHAQLDVGGTVS